MTKLHHRLLPRLLAVALLALALAGPAAASGGYGAIAINRSTGRWGIAYRQPAEWYAKRQALRHCRGKCIVMVWVRDRCAAVVRDRRFVAGMGSTKAAAIGSARGRAHDRRARLVAWLCSF